MRNMTGRSRELGLALLTVTCGIARSILKRRARCPVLGMGSLLRKCYVGLREIKSEFLDQRASRKMGRSAKPVEPERNFCSLELHQETFRWLGPRLCVM